MSAKQTQNRRRAVIVEIGRDWLKIAQIEPARGGIAVTKLHVEPFEVLGSSVAQAMATALVEQKFAAGPVIALVPRQMVTVRVLELPSTEPSEIADMIDLQIGKQTPYSKDEIVADYRILSSEREGYSRILLAIVQRGTLRERFYLFDEAGVAVERMCVSTEGLLNWAPKLTGPGGCTAVLDVDSFYSDLLVVSGGRRVGSRSIKVGATYLLDNSATWAPKLGQEVAQALEGFRSESGDLSPTRIVMAGAAQNIPELSAAVSKATSLPVEVAEPGSMASLPASPSLKDGEFRKVSITALIGVGMAPDEVATNLIPETVTLKKAVVVKAKTLSTFAALLMSVLVCASMVGMVRLSVCRGKLQKLKAEIAAVSNDVARVQYMENVVLQTRTYGDVRFSAINVLDGMQGLCPQNVKLLVVTMDRPTGSVTVGGHAATLDDVNQLESAFRASDLFQDPKQDDASLDARTRRYKFQMSCKLKGML